MEQPPPVLTGGGRFFSKVCMCCSPTQTLLSCKSMLFDVPITQEAYEASFADLDVSSHFTHADTPVNPATTLPPPTRCLLSTRAAAGSLVPCGSWVADHSVNHDSHSDFHSGHHTHLHVHSHTPSLSAALPFLLPIFDVLLRNTGTVSDLYCETGTEMCWFRSQRPVRTVF